MGGDLPPERNSERMQSAAAALMASRQLTPAVLAAASEPMAVLDCDGRIAHANRSLADVMGCEPAALRGRPATELLAERSHAPLQRRLERISESPAAESQRAWAVDGRGRDRPVLLESCEARLGDHVAVLLVFRRPDPPESMFAAVRAVIDASPVAMLLLDEGCRIVGDNPRARQLLGYEAGELIGAAAETLLSDGHRESQCEQVRRFFGAAPGEPLRLEVVGRVRDGRDIPLIWALGLLPVGQERFVLAVLIDQRGRKRREREFHLAGQIQQALLPREAPKLFGFDIAGLSVPAQAAGGDFFGYVPLPDRTLAVMIGDTSGHGFGPALLAATTKSYLQALAHTQPDLANVLTTTNQLLLAESPEDQFVALMVLQLDPAQGVLRYVCAGHEGHLISAAGEVTTRLNGFAPPLGLLEDQQYELAPPLTLQPGDLVLVVTDGVHEAVSPGGEQFGKERLFDVVRRRQAAPARTIVQAIQDEVRTFAQPNSPEDDVTAVVVKARV